MKEAIASEGKADLGLSNTEGDPSLGGVVGGHFHLDAVTDHETDKAFTHFTRNVSEDFVTTVEFDLEHSSGKDGRDRAFECDGLVTGFWLFESCATASATFVAATFFGVVRFLADKSGGG